MPRDQVSFIDSSPEIGETVNGNLNIHRELLSDRAIEIISNQPGFFVRWGSFFFLCVFMLLIMVGWWIKFPDKILSTAKLTSINAPKPVISLTNGKLIKLFISESKLVRSGDILGYIESTGDHEEVLRLLFTLIL